MAELAEVVGMTGLLSVKERSGGESGVQQPE